MPTASLKKLSLPYHKDSSKLFESLIHKPWAVFLDSCFPYSEQGRYDIFAAEPDVTLVTRGDETTVCDHGVVSCSTEEPFLLVKQYLKQDFQFETDLPFVGGALGYFSYDLCRHLETLPVIAKDEENIPEMMIGIYSWAVVVDHQNRQSFLIADELSDWKQLVDQFSHLPESTVSPQFKVLQKPQSNMDKKGYQMAFEKIKDYLTEGDCYQINLAQRFASPCQGDPWAAYKVLRKINAAPFSAYLNFPELQVLSSSPERFLKVKQGQVETKPIKGTRPRFDDPVKDQEQIHSLMRSKKDQAENVMIVDLLRNDMSKNCKEGSVTVPRLFEVESFTTVHHLVSTVKGMLEKGEHALDLLRNCFPGGSITGAPKIRAMEIIEELEPNRRGVYCGSIGYIGFDGNMDTNIAIRTLVHSNHRIRFWAGGGIVNDSILSEEYQESYDKAAALLDLLAQFINENQR